MKIDSLLQNTGMWRASSMDCSRRAGVATGFAELDKYLPGGGWPVDGIAELMHDHPGIGELRLLSPALARLSREQSRWLLWVAPPYVPYAPALAHAGIDLARVLVAAPKKHQDVLWVLEKALASNSCSMVLAWPGNIQDKEIRRLQVASREGNCLGVLFRPGHAESQASPAELRIRLYGIVPSALKERSALQLRILKRRGGWPTGIFVIEFEDRLNQATPDFPDIPVTQGTISAEEMTFADHRSPLEPFYGQKRPE